MNPITISSITTDNASSNFTDPLTFTITIENNLLEAKTLQWIITYIPTPENDKYDQILEEFEINTDL